ncbi:MULTISPECIES: hypothetical protein [Streptomyces]|uniref:hypothetical protein n=1 Tax=Streptomyces TaxID=1883 RepID=UPI00240DEF3D|nr:MULTISPECIES: hypothetical protein [Streptomyces]WFB87551.1 hypothetical protein MMU79_31915 [Streptomyces olivaceus]WGK47150.1 hypothetical protein M6G09_17020 [Streptomyces sp. B146]
MFRKPPSDLYPTDNEPGLRVRAGTRYSNAQGDYVCGGCGAEDHANGTDNVKHLVDDYTAHHGPAHRGGQR